MGTQTWISGLIFYFFDIRLTEVLPSFLHNVTFVVIDPWTKCQSKHLEGNDPNLTRGVWVRFYALQRFTNTHTL